MSTDTTRSVLRLRALRLAGLCLLALGAVTLFVWLDAQGHLSLAGLKAQEQVLVAHYQADPLGTALKFFLGVFVFTSFSIPGRALLGLLAGALFGVVLGTVLMSFATAFGATVALLATRYVLREPLRRRWAGPLAVVDEGMRRDGAYYLFALRLTPIFPFFMVNALMGMTNVRASTYHWVSQLGMLPITLLYVIAGRSLRDIRAVEDVLTPQVLGSLVLLGIFPLLSRLGLRALGRRREKKEPRGN